MSRVAKKHGSEQFYAIADKINFISGKEDMTENGKCHSGFNTLII
jgi:hypothetical protein